MANQGTLRLEFPKRLPKFRREPDALAPFVITARDEEILKALAKFRFLRTGHIRALVPGGQRIFRRLQKLYHAGYVARVYDPDEVRHFREHRLGTPQAIYALDNLGAKLLAEKYGYPIDNLRWDLKNRRIAPQNIQHGLIVSHFAIVFHLAISSHEHTSPLHVAAGLRKAFALDEEWEDPYPWWYMGRQIKAAVKLPDLPEHKRQGTFYPDGFCAFLDSRREQGRNRAFFFLEADNQTLTIRKRMLPKLLAHWAYHEQTRAGESPLQLASFRILHISKHKGRAQNLWEFSRELYHKRLIGGRLHWFASEEDYSLDQPETLLAAIWRTPADESLHSLVE